MDIDKKSKVAILWYWLEGKVTYSYLLKIWVTDITILDKNNIKIDWIKSITGEKYLENLDIYDYIIKSPWISPYENNLSKYNNKILSQAHIFFSHYKWKVIWITWTKWKSTTSTLLYLTLQNAWYKVKLVWNIWNPVLDEIDIIKWERYDYVIYEMSSYMLEWFKPKLYIWYINNMYDCHLEWHNWRKNYYSSKMNILDNAKFKISNIQTKKYLEKKAEINFFWEWTNILYRDKSFFIDWKNILNSDKIKLKWPHNIENITWILAIIKQIKKDKFCSEWVLTRLINGLKVTLENFKWLPHRLEEIWTYKDILFIDDAIATTPEATIGALKTYEQKIWTLFLWGYDYWFDFKELRRKILEYKIKNVVLFPESWEKIIWDLSEYNYEIEHEIELEWLKINLLKTRSMESAVKFAYKYTNPWMICLLSNASASYWLWSSYIEKWNEFQKYVKLHWDSTI